jgi:ABC-type dipeptide/oligopeptide/nickel transport system ATPase component
MPRIKKSDNKLGQIINFYEHVPKKYLEDVENPNYDLHNFELPFRMCIVAPSGSGKTNFLLNLIKIFSQGKGTFADITIVTRNKDEPLYNYLSGEFEQIQVKEGMHNTPKLDDMDKKYNHLVCWDDLVLSKNLQPVEEYYMRARKKSCSVVFLSQSYYDIPKFIRKNSTYLVLLDLGGSKREKTAIMNEWASNLDKDEMEAIFTDATSVKLRPLIITGGRCDKNKKYRKGFTDYYNLDDFLKDIPRTTKDGKRKNKKAIVENDSSSSESDFD